jgi:hypothetical protein
MVKMSPLLVKTTFGDFVTLLVANAWLTKQAELNTDKAITGIAIFLMFIFGVSLFIE